MSGEKVKRALRAAASFVDRISRLSGVFVGIVLLAMMGSITYEVLLRYAFNRPTTWSMEITQYMMVGAVFLAASYTALVGGHVRVDLVISHLPPRWQAMLNLITSVMALAVGSLLLWGFFAQAKTAWIFDYRSTGVLHTPFLPAMAAMVVGFFFMCLQFLVNIGRQIAFISGKGPAAWGRPEQAKVPEGV